MNSKFSHELERLVANSGEEAIRVDGLEGKTYWLLTAHAMDVRNAVLEGIEQADRGEMEPWDSEEINRLGRESRGRNRKS